MNVIASEITLPSMFLSAQVETENVVSCFTVSADKIVEDSYDVRHDTAAYPTSTIFNVEDTIITDSNQGGSDFFVQLESPHQQTDNRQALSLSQQPNERFSPKAKVLDLDMGELERTSPNENTVGSLLADHNERLTGSAADVRVDGACLTRAVVNTAENFSVDMNSSGPGSLNFQVKGPSQPELIVQDVGGNRCQATFLAQDIGTYVIEVTFNGVAVPGSPFITHVTSNKNLDVSAVKIKHQKDTGMTI